MANNKFYMKHNSVTPRYWRDLQIRFDALQDAYDRPVQFEAALSGLNVRELSELSKAFSAPVTEGNKENLIESLLATVNSDNQMLICLFREFTNRRKTSITQYYDQKMDEKLYETPIAQLYELFMISPSHLYEIYTYHMWAVKGTGSLLSSEEKPHKVIKNKAEKIALEQSFQENLCNLLHKRSGGKNNYRVFSYSIFKDRVVLLVYKQVNDTSILDFKENVRNQEVSIFLYQINWEEQTIELKAANSGEINGVKDHAEETFETLFTPHRTDVFRDYNVIAFRDAVLKGKTASGELVEDFLIDRITFRGSPLKNAPEVTLQLRDMDIWPSVMDAYEKGAVNVKSLKDIAFLSVYSSKTPRTIRSIVKDNGNIVFSMDDSRMNIAVKENFSQKFLEKFGVPLFQEISNEKFQAGKADLIDFVMAQSTPNAIREPEEEQTLLLLQEAGLIFIAQEYVIECLNEECNFQERVESKDTFLEVCPNCQETEFKVNELRSLNTQMRNITSLVKNRLEYLCVNEEWILLKETTRTYSANQYILYNYERRIDGKILQVMVTDQVIPNRILQQFVKQMTPLLIVFVGKQEKHIENYNQECIQGITFGEVFSLESEMAKENFNKLFEDLELRSKNYMASAAHKANISVVKNLGRIPSETSSEYTDTEFEDDVFCILKDMFVNAVKWGQEMKGKPVPEGVFSISFRKKRGNNYSVFKYAFSFDCKLTKKDVGYELNKSEQRKAVEYVGTLNNSDYISSYATDNQLTAHIFISNKVKEAQIEGMEKHFREQFGSDYNAVSVFLLSDVLIYLHTMYRKHYIELMQAPNTFLCELYGLLKKPGLVTKEGVDNVIMKSLDQNLREMEFLQMEKLTDDISR